MDVPVIAPPMRVPPWPHFFLISSVLAITCSSLWLRTQFPVYVLADAGHDDALFFQLAYNLSNGLWLGPYGPLTHAKGMFYPLFIAVSSSAGIPLKIAEQIVYLAASGLIAWLVDSLTGRRSLAVVLYAVLAFNPLLWTSELSRIIREGLYIGLALGVVGLTVAFSFLHRCWQWPC